MVSCTDTMRTASRMCTASPQRCCEGSSVAQLAQAQERAGGGPTDYRAMRSAVKEELGNRFKPEFLNRLDEVVVFSSLARPEVEQVASLMIDEVVQRCAGEPALTLTFTPALKDAVVTQAPLYLLRLYDLVHTMAVLTRRHAGTSLLATALHTMAVLTRRHAGTSLLTAAVVVVSVVPLAKATLPASITPMLCLL